MLLASIIGFCSALSSCGSGVDQSNPRSVAEKALECYYNGDYVQLKTLVAPSDTYGLQEMDKMIEMAAKYTAEHPDSKPEPVEFTYKCINDGIGGGDFTDATTTARVSFDSEKWPQNVIVVKVDGKWYFERFK